MVEKVIYLIRHGESIANTQSIYQGQTYDTKLSALGEKQAHAVGERLRNEPITRVIASPLQRTRQTAEAIARWHNVGVEIEPRIIETNHGQWEGQSVETIKKRWPQIFQLWQSEPAKTAFPGGETFAATRTRTLAWWQMLLDTAQGTTVVVAHDNVIRAVLVELLHMEPNTMWGVELEPAAITTVKFVDGKVKVCAINDINHLEGLRANLANHAL